MLVVLSVRAFVPASVFQSQVCAQLLLSNDAVVVAAPAEVIAGLNLPLTGVALVGLALALYLLTPENYLTVRQALPGAIFFAVGWIIATKATRPAR